MRFGTTVPLNFLPECCTLRKHGGSGLPVANFSALTTPLHLTVGYILGLRMYAGGTFSPPSLHSPLQAQWALDPEPHALLGPLAHF